MFKFDCLLQVFTLINVVCASNSKASNIEKCYKGCKGRESVNSHSSGENIEAIHTFGHDSDSLCCSEDSSY